MGTLTLIVWSMALGAIAAATLARLAEFAFGPSRSRLRSVGYHASVFFLVLVLSGLLRRATPPDPTGLRVLQVLAGPLCVALSDYWIGGWLRASQRDRLMALALRACAWLLPVLAVLALLLPRPQQLPAAAALSLLGSSLTLWVTARAWAMGDRLALVMAAGCLLTLPAIVGLYALAMELTRFGTGTHALLALCAALSNGLTGWVLWQRDRHEWHARHDAVNAAADVDPVTRLPTGAGLVRKLILAQQRRRRTGREGAVLAVLVFDVQQIAAQVGTAGVNEMWIAMAGRIQRQVGMVNPVGRYWDRCFVVLVETIPSPARLRTMGLQVAAALRQPIEVTGLGGERMRIRAEIGVGVAHLPRVHVEVEDLLDDAQQLAQAARQMPSRAAMRDPASRVVVPVEQANLGGRRVRGTMTLAAR